MICVEDHPDTLKWAKEMWMEGLIKRGETNLKSIEEWVGNNNWIDFLNASKETRSSRCRSWVSCRLFWASHRRESLL